MMDGNSKEVCQVNSHTEWGLLEEVIVGRPENAFASLLDPLTKHLFTENEITEINKHLKINQPYSSSHVKAAGDAIDRFTMILESEGVIVRHPEDFDYAKPFATPDWNTPGGFCAANPRDVFLVVGNQIIEAPMCSRSRYHEARAYRTLLNDYGRKNARLVSAPKPLLTEDLYNPHFSDTSSSDRYLLTEAEPVFDAADFVRCGRDIIGQLSHVTNQSGVDWLRRHLGDEYNVHLIQSLDPKPMHIDTTLMPLSPGKVLVNPTFTDVRKLPGCFRNWDVLIAPDPVPYRSRPRLMSDWISINTLMLDEERIIVEKRQQPLIKKLKEWGFKPITCDFEDHYPFVGGFHCATLDVRRQDKLKSYC